MTAPVTETEIDFQAAVTKAARHAGWRVNHIRRTIGKGHRWTTGTSIVGWPDLELYRPGRFIMAELKTDRGKVTADQSQVHDELRAAGVDVYVWRPSEWDAICVILTEHRQRKATV